MSSLVKKQKLAINTFLLEFESADILKKVQPGQFLMVKHCQGNQGVCAPVADIGKKTVSCIVKGERAQDLLHLKKKNPPLDVMGPIGNPPPVEEVKSVCLISDSYGIPTAYQIGKLYKKNNIPVGLVVADKSKEHLYWEDKLKEMSDYLMICTLDGSKGLKGEVNLHLRNLLADNIFDIAILTGSPAFMRELSEFTHQRLKTFAIVNPMMIEPLGISGTCRLFVDDSIRYSSIDGPFYDAHSVNFHELHQRVGDYFD